MDRSSLDHKLHRLTVRYDELRAPLAGSGDPGNFAKLSKEFSDLEPIVGAIGELNAARDEISNLAQMVTDNSDPELKAMAEEEFLALKDRIPLLERSVQVMLLPKDAADDKNAILEVR